MLNTRLFEGKEYDLVIYNGQAMINKAFRFYTVVECSGEEIDFDFDDFAGAYFRVYNERSGRLIKDFVLTNNGPYLVVNSSVEDATFEDNGYYYYEIGYVRGVYEQALRYGTLKVI